jgi:hypothetical protein
MISTLIVIRRNENGGYTYTYTSDFVTTVATVQHHADDAAADATRARVEALIAEARTFIEHVDESDDASTSSCEIPPPEFEVLVCKSDGDCPMCRGYDPPDRIGGRCEHGFHPACFMAWLRDNNTCPTCRMRIFARR